MCSQEESHSCGAACARQILRENDIAVSEHLVRDRANYIAGYGIGATDLARALSLLHGVSYTGGQPNWNEEDWQTRLSLLEIVNLRKHWVIVDEVIDSVVYLRDPEPFRDADGQGSEGTLQWCDFWDLLRQGHFQAIWRDE